MTHHPTDCPANTASTQVRPLTVVLVSRHRPTLRKVSRFLIQFGYDVIQARNLEQMELAIQDRSFDILAIDRSIHDRHQTPVEIGPIVAAARELRPWVYSILLAEDLSLNVLKQALRLGIDDFLMFPLNLGEMLFRLRAGARVVEYRRRGRQSGHLDSVTGLLTRPVFTDKLTQKISLAASTDQSVACVAVNLDFCQRYRSDYGHAFYECVLAGIAANFASVNTESMLLGCGDYDQFFIAVPSDHEEDTVEWVQQFIEEFTSRTIAVNDVPVKVSASVGVATTHAEQLAAEELISQALEAQELAKRSGRNTIATYREVVDENTDWKDMAAPSDLLRRTIARDVMIPCTVAVNQNESIEIAHEMLQRARLSVLPVIHDQQQFVGYVTESQLKREMSDATRVGQVAATDVPTFDQNASFAAVMNHFVEVPRSMVFVCRNGQPVGWITQRSLVALSESLNEKSFATNLPASHSTSYLLVPDAVLTIA